MPELAAPTTAPDAIPPSPADTEDAALEVLARCDALAACSEEPGRLTRRFATPALTEAADAVERWMREAGMAVRRDAIGNVVGRREAAAPGARPARTLVLGSHLDSVRDAGRYDGPLGVLVAIAAVARLGRDGRALPLAIEVVGFADEEGVRYGTAYLGSSALAGRFEPAWLERRDGDGIAMADAIRAAGGDPAAIPSAARSRDDLLGYCEVHIEQGPRLEAEGLALGVVSGIVGQARARLRFEGLAGHAGTVPMALRHDALCAAAEWVLAAERRARNTDGLVATVGEAHVSPGAANVIPAAVELSLDVRHADDGELERACRDLREDAVAIAARRGARLDWEIVQRTPPVSCDEELTGALAAAVADAGHRVLTMPSGAGHDAAMLASAMPVAMLFVRCAGGVSHHPDESVRADDVAAAIEVVGRLVQSLAAGER